MQRFFIEKPDLSGDVLTVSDSRITFQMNKVLRMKTGDEFAFFDEAGKEFKAEILEISKREVTANVIEEIQRDSEAELEVHLYQAIPKKVALFELVLQKATELGVTEIFPLITERTENRRLGKFERMKTITIEATEQCGRTRVPIIHHPVEFEQTIEKLDNVYLAYELENTRNLHELLPEIKGKKPVNIFIGPEGGFSAKEITAAKKADVKTFGLGKRILRTETAAIATLGVLLTN